jgi:hypothetical protein
MKKRALAAVLWFYTTWYAWAMLAHFIGISDLAGPFLGLVAAVLFAGDPLGRIWNPRAAAARTLVVSPAASEPA